MDPKNIVITDANVFNQNAILVGYGYSSPNIDTPDLDETTQPGDDQYFGVDVSLDGNRMAVGAPWMQTDGNRTGSVYLYSFDDSSFSNGQLQTIIGKGRAINQADLGSKVHFGQSVSLDTAADGSARLAVGSKNYAASDFGGEGNRQGAVYLYTFTGTNSLNNSFYCGSLAAIIG